MEEVKNILRQRAEEINDTLRQIMNVKDKQVSPELGEAMQYTLFAGGKRIRPLLTVEVARLIEGDVEAAKKAGAALELIHTYSLIHDDLPAMDDDDYRRGKPTNHRIYGEDMAILAGDGLLTYAFQILSELNLPCRQILSIIKLVSRGAGFKGMVGGQALDIRTDSRITLKELKQIHRAKTGALFKSAVLAGAYCGQPGSEKLRALTEFADYLGLTFQIVDDLLDVTGDEEKLGKPVGRDQELARATYTSILGLEKAREEAGKTAARAKEALEIFGERAELLRKLIDYTLERRR